MTKNVLLARPHPFIVAEMKPFFEAGGYTANKLENMTDLLMQEKNSVGAVISLAISSSVGVSAFDVFSQLRRDAPRTPVLFAAMLDFDASKNNLTRLAEQSGIQATILGMVACNESASALGKPDTFLYISKDDLADPARRVIASRMIQRHFR